MPAYHCGINQVRFCKVIFIVVIEVYIFIVVVAVARMVMSSMRIWRRAQDTNPRHEVLQSIWTHLCVVRVVHEKGLRILQHIHYGLSRMWIKRKLQTLITHPHIP